MSKWDDEKTKVKDVFDSIRNYGLTGVVFYIGVYSLAREPSTVVSGYLNVITGICMVLLSVYLFYLNTVSFNRTVQKEYKAGNVGARFLYIIPTLIVMLGFNVFGQTAFSIQTEGGKKLGEITINDLTTGKSKQVKP